MSYPACFIVTFHCKNMAFSMQLFQQGPSSLLSMCEESGTAFFLTFLAIPSQGRYNSYINTHISFSREENDGNNNFVVDRNLRSSNIFNSECPTGGDNLLFLEIRGITCNYCILISVMRYDRRCNHFIAAENETFNQKNRHGFSYGERVRGLF
jgi:hypothetical protein